jgi:hypothetical protein
VKPGVHLSRSSVQQRSNDVLALARAPGVRTLNVGVSTIARNVDVPTIEQNVGVSTNQQSVGASTIAQNAGASTTALASSKLCST